MEYAHFGSGQAILLMQYLCHCNPSVAIFLFIYY